MGRAAQLTWPQIKLDVEVLVVLTTIERVRLMIEDKTGIPLSEQYLSFQGLLLEDGHPLVKYAIKEGSCIVLDLRGSGAVSEAAEVRQWQCLCALHSSSQGVADTPVTFFTLARSDKDQRPPTAHHCL